MPVTELLGLKKMTLALTTLLLTGCGSLDWQHTGASDSDHEKPHATRPVCEDGG